MARTRKKVVEPQANEKLLAALKFVSPAQRPIGTPYQTHVSFYGGGLIAFDGVIGIGAATDQALDVCPHFADLQAAIARCAGPFGIEQDGPEKLKIRTAKFTAYVPCVSRESLPPVLPDPPLVSLSGAFLEGLQVVGFLASEDAPELVAASVLVRTGSMVSTDRVVMLEYWHGHDLPTFAMPKTAVAALARCGKELVSFGYSGDSATFWFNDQSFIRTQLYKEPWPDVDAILNIKSNPWPQPQDFFEGVRAVAPFCENGHVIFDTGMLRSHAGDGKGATFKVQGIQAGPVYVAKRLLSIEPHCKQIDFYGDHRAFFFGNKIRGVLMGVVPPTYKEAPRDTITESEYRERAEQLRAEAIERGEDADIPF